MTQAAPSPEVAAAPKTIPSKKSSSSKSSPSLRLAEAAAEGGLEDLAAAQDAENDRQILDVVSRSSQPLTTDQIASRVGLAEWYVAGRLEGLKEAKRITPIGDVWSAGAPLSERKPQRSRPTFAPRRTPREAVEDAIRDRRLTWSQLRETLPELEPHRIRHGLDLIGRDGFLSFNSSGYTLRKRKGPPSTPIGQPQQADLFA